MAGGKSAWLEQQILNFLLNGDALVPPGTYYLVASTSPYDVNATGAACNEVPNANGYARVAVTADAAHFPAAAGAGPASISTGLAINFPTATGPWGTVQSLYLVDAAGYGTGNIFYGGDCAPTAVTAGASVAVPAGSGVFRET